MIDRAQLRRALGALVVAFNNDGPDMAIMAPIRVLAPLLTGIIDDDAEATLQEVRALLQQPLEPEAQDAG